MIDARYAASGMIQYLLDYPVASHFGSTSQVSCRSTRIFSQTI